MAAPPLARCDSGSPRNGMGIRVRLRVHDLLRVAKPAGIHFDDPAPPWVQKRLTAAPWVVARRTPDMSGWLAAGLRGKLRSERCAIWVHESAIAETIAPEDLVEAGLSAHGLRRRALPAIALLPSVATIMRDHAAGVLWGPTGSVGIELASGEPWVTDSSDLDVMIRARAPLARSLARTLHACLSRLKPRVDLLIEAPLGGIALADWATDGPCLIRSHFGPRLVTDPWAHVGGADIS